MNQGFLRLISVLLLGALLCVPGHAQNYRVKAERYERGLYSPETNPPSVRYAVIDLGPDVEPIRLTNSGYILCHAKTGGSRRWFQGQFETLGGGDEFGASTFDINEAGTVVGNVFQHQAGSAPEYGTANGYAFDSPYTWYGGTSYGIRVAAKWGAGSAAASLLEQPKFPFTIYDLAENSPHLGSATFGGARTIDNDGHIYGQALVAYDDYTPYLPPPDDIHLPTRWGAAYSGYDFTSKIKFGDQRLVYHPEPLWSNYEQRYTDRYVTEGYGYYINQVRNGVTLANGVENDQPRNYINSLPVDFVPVTLNSQGAALAYSTIDPNSFFGYNKFFIYDPLTGVQTDLGIKQSRFFGSGGQPLALDHRTITVTDSSGQPASKVSPQVVGFQGAYATIWEENPTTHQYAMQYLDLMIPEGSGWHLENAKDINDNGAIICTGIYQGQTRACVLLPIAMKIVSPLNGSVFSVCDNINLAATVFGSQASQVTRVEYWTGSEKVGESIDPNGWPAVWTRPSKGQYQIYAKAFVPSSIGFEQSAPVNVMVLAISRKAVDLILDAEVSGPDGYQRRYQRPTWPNTRASGVTIGIGYDLGQNTSEQIRADWGPLLPQSQLDRLVALAGIRGTAARDRLSGVNDVSIPLDTALQVYYRRTLPRYVDATLQIYPTASDVLSPNSFGALVSLVYNRGNSLLDSQRNRRVVSDPALEMRQIAAALENGNFDSIPGLLRNMERIWRGTEDYEGLKNRRNNEADLFSLGLDSSQDQCD